MQHLQGTASEELRRDPAGRAPAGCGLERVDVPEDSPALIMYTSGTTGRPKGAVLTHQNMVAECVVLIRAFELTSADEVGLVASPMLHIGAMGSMAPLMLRGTMSSTHPPRSTRARPRPAGGRAGHHTFLVPAQWQAVCSVPDVATAT